MAEFGAATAAGPNVRRTSLRSMEMNDTQQFHQCTRTRSMTPHRTRSFLAAIAMGAGLFMVIGPYPVALASPLGTTRSAIEEPDSLVAHVALRGGFARRGNV